MPPTRPSGAVGAVADAPGRRARLTRRLAHELVQLEGARSTDGASRAEIEQLQIVTQLRCLFSHPRFRMSSPFRPAYGLGVVVRRHKPLKRTEFSRSYRGLPTRHVHPFRLRLADREGIELAGCAGMDQNVIAIAQIQPVHQKCAIRRDRHSNLDSRKRAEVLLWKGVLLSISDGHRTTDDPSRRASRPHSAKHASACCLGRQRSSSLAASWS